MCKNFKFSIYSLFEMLNRGINNNHLASFVALNFISLIKHKETLLHIQLC